MAQEPAVEAEAPSRASLDEEFARRLRGGIGNGTARTVFAIVIVAILYCIAVPDLARISVRSRVSRVHAEMRSLATAIESYKFDAQAYPPGRPYWGPPPMSLTTPITYLRPFPDPYSARAAVLIDWRKRATRWLAAAIAVALLVAGVALLVTARRVFREIWRANCYAAVLAPVQAGIICLMLVPLTLLLSPMINLPVSPERALNPMGATSALILAFVVGLPVSLAFSSGLAKSMKGAPWRTPPLTKGAISYATLHAPTCRHCEEPFFGAETILALSSAGSGLLRRQRTAPRNDGGRWRSVAKVTLRLVMRPLVFSGWVRARGRRPPLESHCRKPLVAQSCCMPITFCVRDVSQRAPRNSDR